MNRVFQTVINITDHLFPEIMLPWLYKHTVHIIFNHLPILQNIHNYSANERRNSVCHRLCRDVSDCGKVLAVIVLPSLPLILCNCGNSSPQQLRRAARTAVVPGALTLDLFIIFGPLSSTRRASRPTHRLITSTIISSSRGMWHRWRRWGQPQKQETCQSREIVA